MDLDGDGTRDLVSGSYHGGIFFFKGLGENKFGDRQCLVEENQIKKINVNLIASSVAVVDWDCDGDLDIISGNIEGDVLLIKNEGTKKEWKFGKPERLKYNDGKEVKFSYSKTGVCAADWDNDDDQDLVIGLEDAEVVLVRNVGTKEKPELAAPEKLYKGKEGEFRYKVGVADWNGDGLPDLLIGNCQSDPKERASLHGYVQVLLRTKL